MNQPAMNMPEDDFIDSDAQRYSFCTTITKSNVSCMVLKPSWHGTTTVIRPYPSVCHHDKSTFWPYRIDAGGRNRFGYWIKKYDCAWSVGNPPITFLIKHDPNYGPTYNKWDTPLGVLYSAITRACRTPGAANPEWFALKEATGNRRKPLVPPNECVLIQGAILCHKGNNYFVENASLSNSEQFMPGCGSNPPVILVVPGGAARKLIDLLNLENPEFRGDPEDFEQRYVNGDPVNLASGRFFAFRQAGTDDQWLRSKNRPSPFVRQQNNANLASSASNMAGFEVSILKEFNGVSPVIKNAAMVREKWLFWEDVLVFPNYVEQAHMLARHFPASAILYAFASRPEWIPSYLTSKSAVVPASVPAGGQSSLDQHSSGFNDSEPEQSLPFNPYESTSWKPGHQGYSGQPGYARNMGQPSQPGSVQIPGTQPIPQPFMPQGVQAPAMPAPQMHPFGPKYAAQIGQVKSDQDFSQTKKPELTEAPFAQGFGLTGPIMPQQNITRPFSPEFPGPKQPNLEAVKMLSPVDESLPVVNAGQPEPQQEDLKNDLRDSLERLRKLIVESKLS